MLRDMSRLISPKLITVIRPLLTFIPPFVMICSGAHLVLIIPRHPVIVPEVSEPLEVAMDV